MRNRRGLWAIQWVLLAACGASESRETLPSSALPRAEVKAGSAAPPPTLPSSAPVTPNVPSAPVQAIAPVCSIACSQLAVLHADLPADIEVARHWRFEACQNGTCFEGRADKDVMIAEGPEGQYLYLGVATSTGAWTSMVQLKIERSNKNGLSFIEVIFSPQTVAGGGSMSPDHYIVRAKDEDRAVEHELLDENVEYKQVQIHIGENCSLGCWRGRADTRTTSDVDAGI